MQYKKLWGDMHSNIHHEDMDKLMTWYEHAKDVMDFWPIAYYPFYMREHQSGLLLEDIYPPEIRDWDWGKIRQLAVQAEAEGFPFFMGYEWQGAGKDGDHNVFFLANDKEMRHPLGYQELCSGFDEGEAIGIPHHLAYQKGSRGKNWVTHNDSFSPVAEIYSSHGSSENDCGPVAMKRHVHMGPRTGETCYERGRENKHHTGVIASGDNHLVPGAYDHGMACVLAEEKTKAAIWAAIRSKRTYGVSHSRIDVDFTINQKPIGSSLKGRQLDFDLAVIGTDAIDRIELLHDDVLEEMIVHSGTWERNSDEHILKIKFQLELGWGPDTRIYPDILEKQWQGRLTTTGRICSIEKCYNSFGQLMEQKDEKSCEFRMTTYKTTATGKWMGPSPVVTEGFIFEIEGTKTDSVSIQVNGKQCELTVEQLLETSRILPFMDEAKELSEKVFGPVEHYRDDPWWHNAYKIKISQAVPERAYRLTWHKRVSTAEPGQYRLRIWQRNGHIAWTSPILVEEGEDE